MYDILYIVFNNVFIYISSTKSRMIVTTIIICSLLYRLIKYIIIIFSMQLIGVKFVDVLDNGMIRFIYHHEKFDIIPDGLLNIPKKSFNINEIDNKIFNQYKTLTILEFNNNNNNANLYFTNNLLYDIINKRKAKIIISNTNIDLSKILQNAISIK